MAETGQAKVRGNSKANVKRRGSTYTYYLYVTGPDGKRHQHSKGGFKTQREAEDARIAAEYTLSTGTYVKAERVSLADFLVDEWLPTRRPPVLEESTWHSYDRYIQLHVIPHIGRIPLQKLSPVDLNQLYRLLLESGRCQRVPRPVRLPEVRERAVALRSDGLTYEQIAQRLRVEFEGEARISKDAVAALIRRQIAEPCEPADPPRGLSPRTVRYVHTILHAALKDAEAAARCRLPRRRLRVLPDRRSAVPPRAVLGEFDRNQDYFNRDHPDQQIPTINLHGLRHTWATLALSAGIDIKIVSERLNHSSTHITREIYTHVTPPMQSDAAERVARLFIQP